MPKKVTKRAVKADKILDLPYTASIKVMGHVYSAEGEDITQAISKLDVNKARGTSVLTLSKGDYSRSKILSAIQVSRLFAGSPTVREIALRNTSRLF